MHWLSVLCVVAVAVIGGGLAQRRFDDDEVFGGGSPQSFFRPSQTRAIAVIFEPESRWRRDTPIRAIGMIEVEAVSDNRVRIRGRISARGLNRRRARYALHVHDQGNLDRSCQATLGQLGVFNTRRGRGSSRREDGDLGPIRLGRRGGLFINIVTDRLTLDGPFSIIGRSFVLHELSGGGRRDGDRFDDRGRGERTDERSVGAARGCGVIGVASRDFTPISVPSRRLVDLLERRPRRNKLAKITADCRLIEDNDFSRRGDGESKITGQVDFSWDADSPQFVRIEARIGGLRRGREHGWHIHELGNIYRGCAAAGGHWNPLRRDHGDRNSRTRHAGDLGNLPRANRNGEVRVDIIDRQVELLGRESIMGRALVIHERTDDLGRGRDRESRINGNAGPRIACCVIGVDTSDYTPTGLRQGAVRRPRN